MKGFKKFKRFTTAKTINFSDVSVKQTKNSKGLNIMIQVYNYDKDGKPTGDVKKNKVGFFTTEIWITDRGGNPVFCLHAFVGQSVKQHLGCVAAFNMMYEVHGIRVMSHG